MTRKARFILALAAAAGAPAACLSSDSSLPVFPSNAAVYVFNDSTLPLLVYNFTDTASGANLHQHWLLDRGFAGAACIGLVPHAAVTDTFGTFLFGYYPPAIGEVKDSNAINGVVDTLLKTFIALPAEGTHGTYAVDTATGRVKLNWADGTPSQYFDPSADIRLIRDTLTTHAEISAFGDSIHVTWRVTWARGICLP
ncbi:MAG: hypothetical protein ACHQU1_03790 [Gemmatimonadales bacterium]